MSKYSNYLTVKACLLIMFAVGLFGSAFGQSSDLKATTEKSEQLPVKVVGNARRPFQVRLIVGPKGPGIDSASMLIPTGKRLVIENVSAISRVPEGLRTELNFFTHMDSNGDGVGDIADITFHRITLTEQGTFDGVAISTGNHKILVFGDGTIGASQFALVLQARLNGTTTQFTQVQVTFSGYLEDLPVIP